MFLNNLRKYSKVGILATSLTFTTNQFYSSNCESSSSSNSNSTSFSPPSSFISSTNSNQTINLKQDLVLLSGTGNPKLSLDISKKLEVPLTNLKLDRFSGSIIYLFLISKLFILFILF